MNRDRRTSAPAIAIGILGTATALLFAAFAPGLIDDDAYIFLRYAEHLANGDGLAFNAGEPSAGVTSILWVLLLAAGRRLTGVDTLIVAQILGALCFGAALAVITTACASHSDSQPAARVATLIVATSPVFICQVISGMEVALNMLLVAVAASATSALATGLAYATRPDNLALVPLVVASHPRARRRFAVLVLLSVIACGAPWMLYCYRTCGSLLPPTRVGKLLVFLPGWYGITADQFAALSIGGRLALAARALVRVAALFTEGQARVLLPWLALAPFGIAKVDRPARTVSLLFLLSAIAYALFFPLIKLRYFVHLLPWLVPIGVKGLARVVPSRRQRALFGVVIGLHLAVCARALPRYRDWVACEGTKTLAGQWLAAHLAPDARLALEPIGAIGLRSGRYIVDLGGLISRDVWPVIRNGPAFDAAEMLDFLRVRRVDYLIDQVDGPWAGRLLRAIPDSLRLDATIPGPTGCGVIGVYAVARANHEPK
ncbi:MAG TPA: hypothetical protein VMW17_19965 [Candidatus Binatia bacterium]|nr:hypothetical protein [Candidatus Binatia bacterium]